MKIRVEFDIKPKELREVLGLPDVSGIQKEAIETLARKLQSEAEEFDPMAILRGVVPTGLLSVEEWQKLFLKALQAGGVAATDTEAEPPARRKRKTGSRRS